MEKISALGKNNVGIKREFHLRNIGGRHFLPISDIQIDGFSTIACCFKREHNAAKNALISFPYKTDEIFVVEEGCRYIEMVEGGLLAIYDTRTNKKVGKELPLYYQRSKIGDSFIYAAIIERIDNGIAYCVTAEINL